MARFFVGGHEISHGTKVIQKDVDINTLIEGGNFFIKSNNMSHFPKNYHNPWYFLTVEYPADVDKIKQIIVPDNVSANSWILTRTGTGKHGKTITWFDWCVQDFAQGKIFKIGGGN